MKRILIGCTALLMLTGSAAAQGNGIDAILQQIATNNKVIIRRSWMQRRKRLMPMKKQLQEKSASMKTFTRKFKMHSASASARRNTGQLSATSTIVVPARLEVTVAPS